LLGLAMIAFLLLVSPRALRHMGPSLGAAMIAVTPIVVTALVAAGGPRLGVLTLAYVEGPLFAVYMLRPTWAVVQGAGVLVLFAVLLGLQDGWPSPVGSWLFVAANVVGTGVLIGQIARRGDQLAASEREARVELAELNRTLEDRVAGQITEIERLGRLRRFLSPQIADAVISAGSEALAHPHRRRIAVFFCDLRGFTAFTNSAEPEEVLGVMDEYYGAVGSLLQRYAATVGDYAGDGIMAYFGDPVPREDSAEAAVDMARELAGVMAGVVADWTRRGYDLGYGVGIAYGYATLGVIGFDGRHDYKPVGGVVNLAARLCATAGPGQVLLDHATHAETSDRVASRRVDDLALKGYTGAVRAYALEGAD
jgi:class 3 adenylate cyclase